MKKMNNETLLEIVKVLLKIVNSIFICVVIVSFTTKDTVAFVAFFLFTMLLELLLDNVNIE
jgi:hypothetical protein